MFFIIKFICSYVNKENLIYGLFDGFKYAIYLQFVLTIFFPVLGMDFVTTLFWEDIGDWAYRRGSASAIGTFMHPGVLALFSCMAASCFLSFYFNNLRKKESTICFFMCIFIILFTYSRTSYITFLGIVTYLFFVFNKRRVSKSIMIIACFLGIVILIAYFSGVFDLFIQSDIGVQQESRLIHFMLAFDIFQVSPLIGVGINNHVNYMSNDLVNSDNLYFHSFFYQNPIHNIHLIILTELGLLGFLIWLCFTIKYIVKATRNGNYNIISLMFLGILISFIVYGMTGWGPFHKNIYPILILVWCLVCGNLKSKSRI